MLTAKHKTTSPVLRINLLSCFIQSSFVFFFLHLWKKNNRCKETMWTHDLNAKQSRWVVSLLIKFLRQINVVLML